MKFKKMLVYYHNINGKAVKFDDTIKDATAETYEEVFNEARADIRENNHHPLNYVQLWTIDDNGKWHELAKVSDDEEDEGDTEELTAVWVD